VALRVLIVDDSDDDAELTELALRDAGLDVECRRLFREDALRAALAGFAPHVVICDVNLPGYSGSSACALARELAPSARFVFLTGAEPPAGTLPPADAVLLKDELPRLQQVLRGMFPVSPPPDPAAPHGSARPPR
jgi:two-component system OmpR family response regulator